MEIFKKCHLESHFQKVMFSVNDKGFPLPQKRYISLFMIYMSSIF